MPPKKQPKKKESKTCSGASNCNTAPSSPSKDLRIGDYGMIFNHDTAKFLNLKDEMGVYVIAPLWDKSYVKCGLSRALDHRFQSYCHYFPTGFYVLAVLVLKKNAAKDLNEMEKDLFNEVEEQGFERVQPTCGTRSRLSEWFRIRNNPEHFIDVLRDVIQKLNVHLKKTKTKYFLASRTSPKPTQKVLQVPPAPRKASKQLTFGKWNKDVLFFQYFGRFFGKSVYFARSIWRSVALVWSLHFCIFCFLS